jgi:hypothetical protein
LGVGSPIAYVTRAGRLDSARKVTAQFANGTLDIVIIPTSLIRSAELQIARQHSVNPSLMDALVDQATVLQGGYSFLKGNDFEPLFRFISTHVKPRRLDDASIRELAEGFVCDYFFAVQKLERGEKVAAQRWLHCHLGETNFRLLHELRQRDRKTSFPDARRLEFLLDDELLEAITINASPEEASLRDAIEKSRKTCCTLIKRLIGSDWSWPNSPAKPAR